MISDESYTHASLPSRRLSMRMAYQLTGAFCRMTGSIPNTSARRWTPASNGARMGILCETVHVMLSPENQSLRFIGSVPPFWHTTALAPLHGHVPADNTKEEQRHTQGVN